VPDRPPFDAECAALLPAVHRVLPATITPELIGQVRAAREPLLAEQEAVLREQSGIEFTLTDHTVPGPAGDPDLLVSVLRPAGTDAANAPPRPGICYLHGGGMILGNRFQGAPQLVEWVRELGVVVVTPEYRIAPEHPDPAPVSDCYAALCWLAEKASELGVDPAKLVVSGASAGGGLAAGTALMARDRGGPALAGQLLIYPMLDDRNDTASARLFEGVGVWDRVSNHTGWSALLGDRCGTEDVSQYAAPARATDLSGLPATFLDVASTETFRDEGVAYAAALWNSGVATELHVWPGGFHGFDGFAPEARISVEAKAARRAWLSRLFAA
jgi:acetyl esterase/lipase